jgi:hypothetical protein
VNQDEVVWGRVARGLYLVGAGTFLLLNTQGILPWSFWFDAVAYWPVALVALGIRLLFERSRAPWAVVLSPLLVLGTLTYVSLLPERSFSTTSIPLKVDRPEKISRWTLEGRIALARFEVEARDLPDGVLLEGRGASSRSLTTRVSEGSEAATVRLRAGKGSWRFFSIPFPTVKQGWDLGVSRELPLALDLTSAFMTGEADLAATEVTRVDLSGAFNDFTIRLGRPASDARIDLAGGFNNVALHVPPSVPVRVSSHGFVSVVDGRKGTSSLKGPGYRVDQQGAFNHLSVRSP